MAIEPGMKEWSNEKLQSRLSVLEELIAAHGTRDQSKAQVKRHNKQIGERNHIIVLLKDKNYKNHNLPFDVTLLKPMPTKPLPKNAAHTNDSRREPHRNGIPARANPYPNQDELPESVDNHQKYYNMMETVDLTEEDDTAPATDVVMLYNDVGKEEGRATKQQQTKSRRKKSHQSRLDAIQVESQTAVDIEVNQPLFSRQSTPIQNQKKATKGMVITEGALQSYTLVPEKENSTIVSHADPTVPHQSTATDIRPGDRLRDAITAPSRQSGGVPDPTPTYLSVSLCPSSTMPSLQPILIVMDLNGTLLYRNGRSSTIFKERPFAQQFLSYLFANFIVMIWSSARPENTSTMCSRILSPAHYHRVVGIWGRDRFGLTPLDYSRRVQVYKRLERVWADPIIAAAHPYAARQGQILQSPPIWNQTNTILIDDSLEKARSDPFNLIPVPEFSGKTEDPDILRKVAEYLDEVKFQTNVSSFMRARPFVVEDIQVQRGEGELERM